MAYYDNPVRLKLAREEEGWSVLLVRKDKPGSSITLMRSAESYETRDAAHVAALQFAHWIEREAHDLHDVQGTEGSE